MKLTIMQPYFFPYLGYFQLIHAVDTFVVYDDVNYIKRGWINRNFINLQGNKHLITMQLKGASRNRLINQIGVGENIEKLLKTIQHNYCKAPQFLNVFPLIEGILKRREENLATFLIYQIRQICDYLELSPTWNISSCIKKDCELRGQEKILAICEALGATHYVNAPGGNKLYSKEEFFRRDILLSFIQSKTISYPQFGKDFIPNLSIIDVMMFNDKEQCSKLIEEYTLD